MLGTPHVPLVEVSREEFRKFRGRDKQTDVLTETNGTYREKGERSTSKVCGGWIISLFNGRFFLFEVHDLSSSIRDIKSE